MSNVRLYTSNNAPPLGSRERGARASSSARRFPLPPGRRRSRSSPRVPSGLSSLPRRRRKTKPRRRRRALSATWAGKEREIDGRSHREKTLEGLRTHRRLPRSAVLFLSLSLASTGARLARRTERPSESRGLSSSTRPGMPRARGTNGAKSRGMRVRDTLEIYSPRVSPSIKVFASAKRKSIRRKSSSKIVREKCSSITRRRFYATRKFCIRTNLLILRMSSLRYDRNKIFLNEPLLKGISSN